MKKYLLLAALFFSVSFSFAENEKTKLAVIDLSANEVEQSVANNITNRLRQELLSSNDVDCIEGSRMKQILEENGVQVSQCISNECSIETGRLLGVSYVINGSVGKLGDMYSLHVRLIAVETENIIATAKRDCTCPLDSFYTTEIQGVAEELVHAMPKITYSGLMLSTKPAGATLFLNNEQAGYTPYKNRKILSGTYDVTLELDTYETIRKTITLRPGETEEVACNFSHTKRYNDSLQTLDSLKAVKAALEKEAAEQKRIAVEKRKRKKRIKIISRIALGSLSAGLAAGGYYMDLQLQDKMDEKRQIYDEYLSSTNAQNSKRTLEEYNKAHQDGEDLVTYRTLFYIAAGVAAAGLTVTFFF